jgi:trehalose 6-phosphate synthase/phosphatase
MRLIVVSNRLPVTIKETDGTLQFSGSSGGLQSGLHSYLNSPKAKAASEYVWVGWPGDAFAAERHEEIRRRCGEEFHAHPVFLAAEDTEKFYEGFCNNTLWPLFHYFPQLVDYSEELWETYARINQTFADVVADIARPGDLVWVHDYHLMLVPRLLRQRLPKQRLGFFLHIPFPSHEIFRLLPGGWRTALLEGLLGADLVGFHTHDYTQHFLRSVRRILGLDHHMGEVVRGERIVKADTFPMGIDFELFAGKANGPEAAQAQDELLRHQGECKIVLSIDRLDYSKGIDNRLLAYEAFLKANPWWQGRVVLVLIVVPSRMGVEQYRKMKSRIDELVGQINGRFGSLAWTPVVYQFKHFPMEPLAGLYSASDVMLVTPLRDGMNLVAKEYLACRTDGTGVLVLSEMAGAASELGEAIQVNPNDIRGMAEALREGLEMPPEEQAKQMAVMRERLRRYGVVRWAEEFLRELGADRSRRDQNILSDAARGQIIRDFCTTSRRLILCDYDGTLVPIQRHPRLAVPGPELLSLLGRLASASDVVVISGRDRAALESWFGSLPMALVAEHGAWVRERGGAWAKREGLSDEWKPRVRDIMELYVDRLPGAFIEEKESGLAWHYRRAEADLASLRVKELTDHLIAMTENGQANIVEGNKVIEVRPIGVGKGAAARAFLSRDYDFILAVGDDTTDEELFKALPEGAYSIRVGNSKSFARFNVYQQQDVVELLEALAAAGER